MNFNAVAPNNLYPMGAKNLLFIIVAIVLLILHPTDAQIGVCYGRKGNNLPSAQEVVNLYNFYGIQLMRLYDPDQATLKALQTAPWIKLMLGTLNEEIPNLGTYQSVANKWVRTNVVPHASSIKYISVGNEIHPSDPQAPFVQRAMRNIHTALRFYNLDYQIKVSTAIDTTLITDSYPPSNARFINLEYITPILNFLRTYDSPLLVNIQPYAAYIHDPINIRLDYALFTACGTVFTDYNTGLKYQNLFDAIYDAMYTAVHKVVTPQIELHVNNGKPNKGKKPKIVASESGWPSNGKFPHYNVRNNASFGLDRTNQMSCGSQWQSGDVETIKNARIYNTNLINHVRNGSPLTLGEPIETYLFALFDENEKPGDESERHYGLFNPEDMQPKYGELDFCSCY